MTKFIRVNFLFTLLLLILVFHECSLLVPSTAVRVCDSEECKLAAKNLKESIDPSTKPCEDFYQYACGNWPKKHDVPPGLSLTDTLQVRMDENNKEILDFLKKSNSNDEPRAVHKSRQLFSRCQDKSPNYKHGIQFMKNILEKIGLTEIPPFGETKNHKYDYIIASAKAFRTLGVNMFFKIEVEPNLHNRTANVIRLTKPALNSIPLLGYQKLVEEDSDKITQLKIMKEGRVKMCDDSKELICRIFKKPSNIFDQHSLEMAREYERNRRKIVSKKHNGEKYSFYKLQELQNITDTIAKTMNTTFHKFDWEKYIEQVFSDVDSNISMSLGKPKKIQIATDEISFIEEMIKFIYNNTLEQHEFALWWKVNFNILHYSDTKLSESEKTCLELVNKVAGMATSYYYTTNEQYNKLKTEIREMVNNVRDSFKELIEQATWMDSITKGRTINKLLALRSNVVYPSTIKTTKILDDVYGDMEVTNSLFETIILEIPRHIKRELRRYSKINDIREDRWELTPNIVNGFYEMGKNTITIPAGILGAAFHIHTLRALDYGGVGAILGHEITHGFDNSGRLFNEIGEREDWWKRETLDVYKNKTKCFVDVYANYETSFYGITQKVINSESSLGENIADVVGFKEALLAYRKYVKAYGEEPFLTQFQNFTHEQLFTLEFANSWCEHPTKYTPTSADPTHSPSGIRVNGVLKNSEEFSNIWNCPEGSSMNPKNKCSIW